MYPKEMIQIVKNFYNNNNYSIRHVASIFNISKSTIQRWISYTISVDVINIIKSDKEKIMDFINEEIKINPFTTINKIKHKIYDKLNISISKTGVYIFMKLCNLSFKKVSKKTYNNMENIKKLTKQFKKQIKKIKLTDIICLDESCIKSNMSDDYGWSKKGEKLIQYIKSNPKKFNLIMAITKEKIISHKIYDVNVNKNVFYDYLKDELLPKIKNKYILMDNICFHKSKAIIELIKNSGNDIIYIPPYSPEFNPIEVAFHMLKHKIRKELCEINSNNINMCINNISSNFRKIYYFSFRR